MRQQKVVTANKHGNKILGILHESGGTTQEIVILCHGLPPFKDDNIMVNLAAALENAGISAFRFDFTGNGESEGSFEFGNYCREVDDLHAVAQHFRKANRTVSAIIGHGKGANAVLLYASKYHDVKTVVNLSGRYDMKEGLHIDKECRFLTVHGSEDATIPVGDAFEFAKILPNHKLHVIEGADHLYTDHQAELASTVVDFMKETLQQNMPKVIIANKQGNKLVGILHDSGTTEIAIICHGLRGSKEIDIVVNIVAALENAGISVFSFDFSGNGESEGSFGFGNFWREVDDLDAVVQHFHKANRTVSAIIGHSKGANVMLLYASKYHDVKTFVNLSGCYYLNRAEEHIEALVGKDFRERMKKEGFVDLMTKSGSVDYRISEEGLKDWLTIKMHEECLRIDKECRFLTVHGSGDETAPIGDAFEFAQILPNHKLHIIEGADHLYTDHQAELPPVVADYMKETLQIDKRTAS